MCLHAAWPVLWGELQDPGVFFRTSAQRAKTVWLTWKIKVLFAMQLTNKKNRTKLILCVHSLFVLCGTGPRSAGPGRTRRFVCTAPLLIKHGIAALLIHIHIQMHIHILHCPDTFLHVWGKVGYHLHSTTLTRRSLFFFFYAGVKKGMLPVEWGLKMMLHVFNIQIFNI